MKKIRIIALLLVIATLTFCLFGCKEQEKVDFFSTLKDIKEIKNYEFESTLSLNQSVTSLELESNIDMNVRITGKISDAKNAYVKLECKNSEMEDYIYMTDMYMIDKDIYINMKAAFNAMDDISQLEGRLKEAYTSDKEYYKVSVDTIMEETDMTENSDLNAFALFAQDAAEAFCGFVEKTAKNMADKVISEKDGTFTATINNQNITEFIQELATIMQTELTPTVDNLIKEYETKGDEYKECVDALKDLKENELEDILSTISEMKEFKMEDNITIESKMSITLKEENKLKNANINIVSKYEEVNEEVTSKMEFNMNGKIIEKESITIVAPTSILTEEEFQNIMEKIA